VGCEDMDWIELAQNDRWKALTHAVLKILGSKNGGNFSTS